MRARTSSQAPRSDLASGRRTSAAPPGRAVRRETGHDQVTVAGPSPPTGRRTWRSPGRR
ncbi:hypothetical protein [Ornithinimicrobium kibberense]|uniref:hypothetical protein n=1 Tax=Ornithinimicrobium kibberense TaxID=282060 RepID=UPI00361DBA87